MLTDRILSQVSIDDHSMIVYAADGNYVEPQEVDILLIGVGARCELVFRCR